MSMGVIHNERMRKTATIIVLLAGLLTAGAARAQIGLDFLNLPPGAEIGDVLARLYVWSVGLVAIIAVIMLVIGGVQYMVAGEKDPSSAKERIRNAIWGLILALTSYLILYTINPDLTKKVKLKILDINVVEAPELPIAKGTKFTCSKNPIIYPSLESCTPPCTALNGQCSEPIVGLAVEGARCNRTSTNPPDICASGLECAQRSGIPPFKCFNPSPTGNCVKKADLCP